MTNLRPHTPSSPQYHPHPLLRAKVVQELSDCRHPSRPKTPHARTYDESARICPWHYTANTYAWVAEQESVRLAKGNSRKADCWVLEQQIFLSETFIPKRPRRVSGPEELQKTIWEEMIYGYEADAARWMRHQEEVRRMAIQREKEKSRVVQQEVRRIEARIRQRRIQEKQRVAEERMRACVEQKEREKKEQAKADQMMIDAWGAYETRWAAIASSSDPLTFHAIPWPVVSQHTNLADLIPANIIAFFFSPLHSKKQSRKERIRSAQLRWHPDRFRRLMGRVVEKDKLMVEEGVGIVARCLNDLMAQETSLSHNAK